MYDLPLDFLGLEMTGWDSFVIDTIIPQQMADVNLLWKFSFKLRARDATVVRRTTLKAFLSYLIQG